MILSGINNYCATEDVKYQMDNSYVRKCTNEMNSDIVKQLVNLGNAAILEIEYSDKLTWLKVKSNGHIYVLQENFMVEEDSVEPGPTYVTGDLLKVDVGGEIQNIYVLKVNGEEVVGILDRNLGNTVAWISQEDYNAQGGNWLNDTEETKNENLFKFGPITANKFLEERTSTWGNVTEKYLPSAIDILKLTEFYQQLEINGDTENWESKYLNRGFEALAKIGNCYNNQDCKEKLTEAGYDDILLPDWITINLNNDGENSTYGYWTSTPMNYISQSPNHAWCVYIFGMLHSGYSSVEYSDHSGIRPIIHINKSYILEKLNI